VRTDFGLFQSVAETCQAGRVTEPELSSSTGFAPRRKIALRVTCPDALDLYRICQIADVLEVSSDWLMGRLNVIEMQEPPK
jgi:hypothetical protein